MLKLDLKEMLCGHLASPIRIGSPISDATDALGRPDEVLTVGEGQRLVSFGCLALQLASSDRIEAVTIEIAVSRRRSCFPVVSKHARLNPWKIGTGLLQSEFQDVVAEEGWSSYATGEKKEFVVVNGYSIVMFAPCSVREVESVMFPT